MESQEERVGFCPGRFDLVADCKHMNTELCHEDTVGTGLSESGKLQRSSLKKGPAG